MEQTLRQIERELGFPLPTEILSLYNAVVNAHGTTYVFDTRSAGSHSFLNADYFLVKPEDRNTKERGDYFIKDFYVGEDEKILERINQKVSKSVKEYWSEDKVFAFAWSNDVVEKDASLLYVFNKEGAVKGVYVHSLNYVEDKVFVAKSLSDVFNLEVVNTQSDKVRFTVKGDKGTFSYKELLKGAYKIIDLESVDDVRDYEHVIKIFADLSGGKFSPIIKSLSEQDAIRNIEIEINGVKYSTQLQGDTDYVDLKLIDFVNKCLIDNGHTRKRFIAFSDANFGQEIGVAFVSKSGLESLRQLNTLKIDKE